MTLCSSSAELMIAISTPRIQSSKFLLSVAPRHGGQDMHIRAIIYDASQHVEQHTFEQSAGRWTGVYC
jgi:hypothetical protein